jgi:MmyB-like transcription regulator ligand binding domain/Helix-turn-helix domain
MSLKKRNFIRQSTYSKCILKDILKLEEDFSWDKFSQDRSESPKLREREERMDVNEQAQLRRRALADFLRTRRERLRPEQLHLSEAGRRRTPGLRRDEVAHLADVSVDLYTRLEQARSINVSETVLESLVRALHLNEHEREHLFLLAHQHLPPETVQFEETVSPALQRYLDRMETCPAYILGKRWDILARNRATVVLFDDDGHMGGRERNCLWRIFTSPYMRQLLVHWDDDARLNLAQFRASTRHFLHDPWLADFVEDLRQASPQFRAWWPMHDVLTRPESSKVMRHPEVGLLLFDYLTFQVHDAPDLTIVAHIPQKTETEHKMRQLLENQHETSMHSIL